jgi:hypothetical protein
MKPDAALAAVPRLHPIRVLVVSRDRRFLRVARVLLMRAGFAVETAESSRNVNELIARCRINVAIIDASGSLTKAARTIGALGALAGHVKAVAVADRPDDSQLENLRLLPKWSHWEDLLSEVELAYAATC